MAVWLGVAVVWGEASARPAIGVVLPLSGKHKRLGQATLDALNIARQYAPDLEVVVADSGGEEAGARRAVASLAEHPRVLLALGPLGWKESRAAGEEAQRRGLPIVLLSSEEGVEALGPWVFRGRVSVEEQARFVAGEMVRELQVPRYAILYPDDELGRAAAFAFFEVARQGGARVTSMVAYRRGDTNMTEAVEELVGLRVPRLVSRSRSAPPRSRVRRVGTAPSVDFDALFIPDYDDSVALLTRFLRFVDVPLAGLGEGSSIQLLGISHLAGPRLAESEGLVAGAVYSDTFDVESGLAGVEDFTTAYRDAYKRDPTDLDAQAHDLFMHAASALRLGATDATAPAAAERERVRVSLSAIKPWVGLSGRQWLAPSGAPGHELTLWVVNSAGVGAITSQY